jgi:hypothetical protein
MPARLHHSDSARTPTSRVLLLPVLARRSPLRQICTTRLSPWWCPNCLNEQSSPDSGTPFPLASVGHRQRNHQRRRNIHVIECRPRKRASRHRRAASSPSPHLRHRSNAKDPTPAESSRALNEFSATEVFGGEEVHPKTKSPYHDEAS